MDKNDSLMDTNDPQPETPGPSNTYQQLKSKENDENKRSFKQFILSIPRKFSPSVFKSSTNQRSNNNVDSMDADCDQFNWSIDQLARLNPIDFSFGGHVTSFDQSLEMHLMKESEEFFQASVIVPTPSGPTSNPRSNSDENDQNSDNLMMVSINHSSGMTPVRSFMNASETKVPTPVNVFRSKQKKKLFAEDRNHFSFDTLDEESSQEAASEAAVNVLHSSNLQDYSSVDHGAYMHASLTCSPILGNTSICIEEDEVQSMEQETVAYASNAMASVDSGCVTAKSTFFKTSTPSRFFN